MRNAMLCLLESAFPNCELLEAECAEEGLSLCEAAVPDVVVMDIALPGMSGIDATRHVRALYPKTRVVIHSSSDMQIFRDESAAAGACAFVGKGLASSALVSIIAGLLESVPHPP